MRSIIGQTLQVQARINLGSLSVEGRYPGNTLAVGIRINTGNLNRPRNGETLGLVLRINPGVLAIAQGITIAGSTLVETQTINAGVIGGWEYFTDDWKILVVGVERMSCFGGDA